MIPTKNTPNKAQKSLKNKTKANRSKILVIRKGIIGWRGVY